MNVRTAAPSIVHRLIASAAAVLVALVGVLVAAPAQAAGTRTISGTFTIPASGIESWWAETVYITAYDSEGDWAGTVDVDYTAKTFSLTGLEPGVYKLEFGASLVDHDSDGYWESANLLSQPNDAPTVVDVTAGDRTNVSYAYVAGSTVSGTVSLAAGADSAWKSELYAQVSIPGPEGCNCGDSIDTKVDPVTGAYVIRGLPAKQLTVYFAPKSGSTANLIPEFYNNAYTYADSTKLDFATGNKTNINATLELGKTISGTVSLPAGVSTDALRGIYVYAEGDLGQFRAAAVNTTTGAYTVYGLIPDNFTLEFASSNWSDGPDTVYTPLASVYYGGAYTAASSTKVNVTTANATGKNITMPVGRTISGTVTLGSGIDAAWKPYLSVYAEGTNGAYRSARVDATTGAYTVKGLAPDTYTVNFASIGRTIDGEWNDGNFAYEYYNNKRSPYAADSVSAIAGNVTGINATIDAQVGNREFWVTPTPTISGTASVGSTLAAVAGTWEPYTTSFGYQWKRDGANIAGATSDTYAVTQADAGASITVAVTGARDGFTSVSKTSAALAIPASAYVAAPLPTITGTPATGQTLTANTGTWNPVPAFSYQWKRNGVSIASATSSTYALTASDEGTTITVDVTGVKAGYVNTTKTSAGLSIPGPFTAAPVPTISGTPAVGQALTAVTGTWNPAPDFTYQWKRNGGNIGSATSSSYTLTPADLGATITVAVTGTKAGYITTSKTSAGSVVAEGAFASAPAPTVTGTLIAGNVLTANVPAWTPTATFTYQWMRGVNPIASATGSTYTLTLDDIQQNISVKVTGTATGYAATTAQSAGQFVNYGQFTNSASPVVSGTAAVGETLSVTTGSWTPTPNAYVYRWVRDNQYIAGATASTYILQAADAGAEIYAEVTATKFGYQGGTKTSTPVEVAGQTFTATPAPIIAGTAKVGSTLTAQAPVWEPQADAFTYQWLRDGVAIDGATNATYVLTVADYGHAISVKATGDKALYTSTAATSTPTVTVAAGSFTTVPTPKISGSTYLGATLTATAGTWVPAASTLKYQWYRSGSAISGATAKTYKLTSSDSGKKITVKVTGSATGYATASKTSSSLTLSKFFTKTGSVAISGTVKVGSTVTASKGTWSPTPSSYSYQWYRDGVAISGATKSTYTVSTASAGKKLTVKVTAKRSGYASQPKTSAAKTVAYGTFKTAPTPKISGTAKVGSTLKFTRGTWSPTPSSYSYQWYRSGSAISGATGSSYKLTSSDKGKTITVKVTAKKTGYTTTSRTSAKTSTVK
ncbi:hypothetical protein [Demequina sp.]|uniref:hypothetical protein n=1 Tax=Demequina sp. TaxID=2050685 RepID=UPI003D14AF02